MSLTKLVVCAFVPLLAAYAQDARGNIRGRVTDSSQAVMVGVEVRAANVDTGVTASAQTNASGAYNIPFLLPGTYRVTAELAGFKKFSREGIQVRVSETVELPISMDVGSVTETLEVTGESPVLDTAGASLGQVVDQRRALELPIAAGNPLQLMLLSPGLTEPSTFLWKPAWNFRQLVINGNGATNNEFTIDGVSNTFADSTAGQSRFAFSPPQTAVSEFKIQTSAYDASVGHAIGATVNVSTKNGTNELHGEAHWFVRNKAFDTPSFFNNKNNTKQQNYQDNRYGASAGGPVWIPKVYNGKTRTFWFYAYEGNKWGVPQPYTGTVPTAAERAGNFSELLALGSRYQIYDPATVTSAPGGRTSRTPFAGNVIPTNRLDLVALNLLKYYPLPNQAGTSDGRNNYFNGSATAKEDYYVHLARVDHAFSDKHRAFIRVNYDWWAEDKNHYINNPADGIVLNRINRGLALDDVYVVTPSVVLNVRYGLTQQEFPERRTSRGTDLAALGFSPQLTSMIDGSVQTLPRVGINGYYTLGGWESGDGTNTSLTHSLSANFTKAQARHNLRFGFDGRLYRSFGNRFPRATAPDLSFGTTYVLGPLDNSPAAPIGQELASMLLGIPGGSMQQTGSYALQDRFLSLYVQDGFKVTPKLTLDIGLRYEWEGPITERFNRLVAGYAFDTPNPIEAQAKANYAKNPIPELPVDQFRVTGGQLWVDSNNRSPFRGEGSVIMPRLGLAYQLTPTTMVRTGYGIFYDTMGVNTTSAIQTGFSQSTPIQASLDNGFTFSATTANPFPTGLQAPLGAAGGLTTNLGQGISFYNASRRRPYSQRWSFGVQQMLPKQFLLEAEYVGNKAIRLPITRELDALPAQYLSTSPFRDQKTIDYLSATFANPLYGTNPIFGTVTSRSGLLRPYPQFSSVSVGVNSGYSWYHSLQARVEKRFSGGFTFLLGYTWAKAMEATQFLNAVDPLPYRSIASFDRPQRLSVSGIWEIPFGKGRKYGSHLPAALEFLAGGWQLDGLVIRQAGPPLGFGNAIFTGDLHNIPLPKEQRSVEHWFNVNAGFNRDSSQQLASNLRGFPLLFSGIRGDGRANWDFSAIKNFAIHESFAVQFRAEAYNSLNHPNFNAPNTSPTSSAFGTITGTASDPRNFQFSLKVKY